MQPGAVLDHVLFSGGLECRQIVGVCFKPLEELSIADQGDLDRLGDPGNPFPRRQALDKVIVVQHGPGRGEGAGVVLHAFQVHRILYADATVILAENGRRQADQAHAAVRRRGGQTNRIQHGAAADGDDIGMAVDMCLVDQVLQTFQMREFGLDPLTARDDHRRRRQRHMG